MSIRDFFSNSFLKQSALEFLKCKADFNNLASKHKKAFRGVLLPRDGIFSKKYQKTYKGPLDVSDLESSVNPNQQARLIVSDGYNSVPCTFSEDCIEDFEDNYPSCIKIHEVTNMLVCILDFKIICHSSFEDPRNVVDHGFFVQGSGGQGSQINKKQKQ
jgi:hypothetical protein